MRRCRAFSKKTEERERKGWGSKGDKRKGGNCGSGIRASMREIPRATFGNAQLFRTRYTRRRRDRRNRRKISAASNRIPFSFRGKLLLNETPLYTSFLCLKIWHETLRLKIHTQLICCYYYMRPIIPYVLKIVSLILINFNFSNLLIIVTFRLVLEFYLKDKN